MLMSIGIPNASEVRLAYMTTLAKRLQRAMKEKPEITQVAIARACGIKPPSVSDWLSGKTKQIKGASLMAAARILEVNPEWLATGKPPMKIEPDKRAGSGNYDNDVSPLPTVMRARAPREVPVVEVQAIGETHFLAAENTKQFALVASDDELAFVVRVENNDMYPRYMIGEYALVEPGIEVDIEDDVLVRLVSGETLLRRLASRKGGVRLSAYNLQDVVTLSTEDIVWMYYVTHPVPAKQIHPTSR